MNLSSMKFFIFIFIFFTYSCISWRPIVAFLMELKFYELEFHAIFIYFLSLIAPYLIFYKSSYVKLDFEKIELQKMDISLISLEKEAKL